MLKRMMAFGLTLAILLGDTALPVRAAEVQKTSVVEIQAAEDEETSSVSDNQGHQEATPTPGTTFAPDQAHQEATPTPEATLVPDQKLQAVTATEKEITYEASCDEVENTTISYTLKIYGYDSTQEYYNSGKSISVIISETADFENRRWCSTSCISEIVDGKCVLSLKTDFIGKENTTYYIRPIYYDTETGQYIAVADDIQATTKTARVYNLDVTCPEPTNTIIRYAFTSDDFSGWSEFSNMGYQLAISKTEDFSNAKRLSFRSSSKQEGSINHMSSIAYYAGEENTEYYLKLQYYDNNDYTYKDVAGLEVQKVTTGKKVEGCGLTPGYVGAGALTFEAKLDSSIGTDVLSNGIVVLQLAEDQNFTNLLSSSGLSIMETEEPEEDGAYYRSTNVAGGIIVPEKTYYARLCLYDSSYNMCQTLTDAVKVTTEKNTVYTDSDIPDEELRNAIKNTAGVLDRQHLEAIQYLSVERQKGTAGISDLTGLELLPSLETLYLQEQMITDISVLAKCTRLSYVNLSNNRIRTIPDLSSLKKISWLALDGNFIPKDEIKITNQNIPENLRNVDWIQSTQESQRESEEIGFTFADVYYLNSEGKYPLQVEINNTYSWPEYTLSIYQGDKLVKENVEVTSKVSYYNVADWLIDDLDVSAGSYNFTFVVSADGAEVGRITRKMNFSDENVYVQNINYMSPEDTYVSMNLYVYNTSSTVEKYRILNSAGDVMLEETNLNQSANSWDSRYNNVFKNNLVRNNPLYVYASRSLEKYLKEGNYTAELVMKDGSTYKSGTVITVTTAPIVKYVSTGSNYENSLDSDDFFVSVSGTNLDWKKLSVELYDGTDKIAESRDYKITSTNYAIFRTVKASETEWPRQMTAKVFYDGKQIDIVNNDNSLWFNTSTGIYYAEYNIANKTVSVYGRNVEEGKTYTAQLSYYGQKVYGQCDFSFTNGEAEIEFFTEDGEKYEMDSSISQYYIGLKDSGTVSLTNPMYKSTYNYTYPSTVDGYRMAYVNDGSVLNGGASLNASALTEDSIVTAELMDADKNSLAETGVSTKKYQNDNGDAYWYLGYAFTDVTLANDTLYYVKVKADGKDMGSITISVLDPVKMYYSSSNIGFVVNNTEMTLTMNGFWKDNLQADKLRLDISSASGIKIATMDGTSLTLNNNRLNVTFDYASCYDALKEYASMTYKVFYDNQEITYAYGDGDVRTFRMYTPNTTGYLMSGRDSKTNANLATGVYSYSGKAMTVYIYYPYGTTALKTLQYTGVSGTQYFTDEQLDGLKYGVNGKQYDVVLTDVDGNFISQTRAYLDAQKEFKFDDVDQNSWMYTGVNYVYQKGIMTGKSNNKFDPTGAMTRAEFVTTLYSMQGRPTVSYENKFSDVADGQWYTSPVMWAYQNQVVGGYANGSFGTSDKITREQLALMLYKYAKDTCGVETTYDENVLEHFADKDKISSWSKEALQWAVTNGVMGGKGENLDPLGNATRAECATMLRSFDINILD